MPPRMGNCQCYAGAQSRYPPDVIGKRGNLLGQHMTAVQRPAYDVVAGSHLLFEPVENNAEFHVFACHSPTDPLSFVLSLPPGSQPASFGARI